jgi:hypothetical protein
MDGKGGAFAILCFRNCQAQAVKIIRPDDLTGEAGTAMEEGQLIEAVDFFVAGRV